jgi:peptide chain release factor 1
MNEKMDEVQARHRELERLMSDPDLHKDQKRAAETMREHARLTKIVETWKQLQSHQQELEDNREIVAGGEDPELTEMANSEVERLEAAVETTERALRILLVPPDPLDAKNTIMEIRAGTGGDEASLFAADLFRMYSRYSEGMGWKVEVMERTESEVGGFKEIIFSVTGNEVFSHLKFERGVHRVQRVPSTESAGRIHTSAVTVAVLPEAEETDVDIRTEDLRIDVFRSSGPGGQSVNTTDSAVRVTHLPSGLVVSCQDEKSQHKNKAKALRVLKARLFELEDQKRKEEYAEARKSQVGSGDRSERIRTYNFPQSRLTDHRINLTLYKLDAIMEGALEEVIEALQLSAGDDGGE